MTALPISSLYPINPYHEEDNNNSDWISLGYFSEKRNDTVGFCSPTYLLTPKYNINFLAHHFGEHLHTILLEYMAITKIKNKAEPMDKDLGKDYYQTYLTFELYVKREFFNQIIDLIGNFLEDFDINKCRNL